MVLAIGSTVAHADPEVEALVIATGIIAATAIVSPEHDESSGLEFEVGGFDAVKNVQPASAFGIEYHFGRPLWWKLRPFAGGGFTSQHAFYGYGGIRLATFWGEHVVVTPSFAVGGYSQGAGKDLGQPPVLGRFGIDLEYQLDNDVRIGVAYHHLSNGKVLGQTENPGTEVVGVTLSIPIR